MGVRVRFEERVPFEDGNGRIGRLILFKERLCYCIMPFIIDDKRRSRNLHGIKEWHDDRFEMIDVVMEAQNRFEDPIELKWFHAAGPFFSPISYQGASMLKMNEFMTALQTHLANQKLNYPDKPRAYLRCCSIPITNPAASITQSSKPTSRNSTGL